MDKEQKNVDHKNFDNLVLNKDILKGLYLNGFNEPSSIQIKGIESINSEKDYYNSSDLYYCYIAFILFF